MQSLARDEGSRAHVLAPLASDDEIGKILMEVGWRPVSQDVEWRSVSRAYVWALATGLSPLFLVAIGQMVMVPPLGAAFLALFLAAVAVRWFAWRRTAYALDRDRLLVRSGWWRRRTRILPLTNIQSIDLRENFVSRLFATASLLFGVAGGSGAYSIPAIPRADARKLRYQLLGSKP
jgi:putative membrane protein